MSTKRQKRMLQSWKTHSRAEILNHSKFLRIELHTVELPDGRIIVDWPWVITPDYVNIVAVTEEGKFLCFRQTKYAIDGVALAPVGGYLEPGEEPLAAARRELLEETGYEASDWLSLGHYRVDGNRGAGTAHLFLAQGARFTGKITSDDLEEQELLQLSRAEVETALNTGQFKVLAWTAAFALALRHLPA
jgi:8-oxo-dGTP pyrophosphatase MutT (NUDIX family)